MFMNMVNQYTTCKLGIWVHSLSKLGLMLGLDFVHKKGRLDF